MKLLGFVHTKKFGIFTAKTSNDEALNGGAADPFSRYLSLLYQSCIIQPIISLISTYNCKCAPMAGTPYFDAFWYDSHSERFRKTRKASTSLSSSCPFY
jgi:hypothetical protein